MPVAILDINDCNVQLWHGQSHVQSPGYALLDGREYRFGATARGQARLRPRDVATRYWWQLNTQPLQPALGPARHSADLVHAHLLEMHREAGEPEQLLLAIPGSMERDQVALLLGIAEQCPFSVAGLVNRSVALSLDEPGPAPLYHLEFQLHQAVLTALETGDGQRRLGRVQALAGCGLLQLQERIVEIIAATFIRQTRFDPRRKAATEQALYDAIPGALKQLREASEVQLEVAGYNARISAAALADAGQRLFTSVRDIVGNERARLLADPLAGLLPGAMTALQGLTILDPARLPANLESLEEQLTQPDAALVLVRALPCAGGEAAEPAPTPEPGPAPAVEAPVAAPPQPAAGPRPTHLLQGFTARPLVAGGTALDGGWELFHDGEGWLLRGSAATPATVNGQVYGAGRQIHCGDTLAVAGALAGVVIEVK